MAFGASIVLLGFMALVSLPALLGVEEINEQGLDNCSKDNIYVHQEAATTTQDGYPTYTVQIVNICTKQRDFFNIHLSCGTFSSVTPIDPKVFQLVSNNDCLVKNGKPLRMGEMVTFNYDGPVQYPLAVSSFGCS